MNEGYFWLYVGTIKMSRNTKGTDSKQNLFRLIPYRLFHGELVIQDKAQHSSVDFNLLN